MPDRHKIRDIRFFRARSPLSQPIADATHTISDIDFFITEIETRSGVIGQGYLLAFHYSPRAIAGALLDMKDFAKEFSVNETVRMNQAFLNESEYFGQNGLLKWAMASLDIAMWDAWAKSLGQPIWKLLGGIRRQLPFMGREGGSPTAMMNCSMKSGVISSVDFPPLKSRLVQKRRGATLSVCIKYAMLSEKICAL